MTLRGFLPAQEPQWRPSSSFSKCWTSHGQFSWTVMFWLSAFLCLELYNLHRWYSVNWLESGFSILYRKLYSVFPSATTQMAKSLYKWACWQFKNTFCLSLIERTARWPWSRWAQSRRPSSPSSSFTTTIWERTTTFECPSPSPPSECLFFLPPSLCHLKAIFLKFAFSGIGNPYIFMTVVHCEVLLPSPPFLIILSSWKGLG